jgi:hypothetical protein
MKRVIRLTESDLARIVKRVINEGESEDISEKLIQKLKQNGFSSKGSDRWEMKSNGMSVEVQISGGLNVYSVVKVDNSGYSKKGGTLYDQKIVNQSIEVSKLFRTGDKKEVLDWLKTNGWSNKK